MSSAENEADDAGFVPARLRGGEIAGEAGLRRQIVDAARRMNAAGINQGTSGNISARLGEAMLITPSAMPYEEMRPEAIVAMPLDDPRGGWTGPWRPSTEWRFHQAILRERADAGAVVHTHAPYCTTLACLRRGIPAVHYMIAAFGGADIRCAPYATFGSAELAAHAVEALRGRAACLLANHGMIVLGPSIERAMWLAVELETIARQYCLSLQTGTPVLLSDAEVADAMLHFADYARQSPASLPATS